MSADYPEEAELSDAGARVTKRVTVGIFLLLAGIYSLTSGGHTYSSDEEGMFATTRALVERQSVTLRIDEGNIGVVPVRAGRTGEPVGASGLGQSLVAIPLYLLGSLAATAVAESYVGYTQRIFVGWTNSIVTAVGAVMVFHLARLLGARRRPAIFLSLTYGLATMAWPHAKTFFSEPLATTLVLMATYFAVRAGLGGVLNRRRDVILSGGFAALALFARSTTAIFAPLIFFYLLWRAIVGTNRNALKRTFTIAVTFCGGAAVPGLLFLTANWWRFGSPLDFGYPSVPLHFPMLEGLYGLFLSPGKSLFLYAPVTLVGLLAIPFVPRHRRPEVVLLAALGAANAVFFSRFVHWHGDHAWGPRYLMMTLPFFVLPVAALLNRPKWWHAVVATAGLGVASALLGTAMYFNQYFHIAEAELGLTMLPEGPSYWKDMHFDPEWSPIVGHFEALPDAVSNSWARLDGEDPNLETFPHATNRRYGWYFAPPQLDSWVYWLFPTGGPKKLLLFAPLFGASALTGVILLRRNTTETET